MKKDSSTGELELLSFGARDVWHRGPDPPCLRPDGITDERGTSRGLVGPPRRYLRPDDVRDNWDVPAGGAGDVVVRMAALCTDVPADRTSLLPCRTSLRHFLEHSCRCPPATPSPSASPCTTRPAPPQTATWHCAWTSAAAARARCGCPSWGRAEERHFEDSMSMLRGGAGRRRAPAPPTWSWNLFGAAERTLVVERASSI